MELFNSTIFTFKLEYANSTLKLVTNFKVELGFLKSAPIIGNFNLSSEVQCRVISDVFIFFVFFMTKALRKNVQIFTKLDVNCKTQIAKACS